MMMDYRFVLTILVLTALLVTLTNGADANCSLGTRNGQACCPKSCFSCDATDQCPTSGGAAVSSPCCTRLINISGRRCKQFKAPCTFSLEGEDAKAVPDVCISTNGKNVVWCFCYLTLFNRVKLRDAPFYSRWCETMKTKRGFGRERSVCNFFDINPRKAVDNEMVRTKLFPVVNEKVATCGGCPTAAFVASRGGRARRRSYYGW